jgi:hypothetical protein
MDLEKIRTIQEWPRPETVQHVRPFCGLCSLYRQFLDVHCSVTHGIPLTRLHLLAISTLIRNKQ